MPGRSSSTHSESAEPYLAISWASYAFVSMILLMSLSGAEDPGIGWRCEVQL